jgi:hypothetical protein
MSFSEETKHKIREDCYVDPVLFAQTFLFEHFYRPIPWVHRALFAILTGKANFLLKYGDIGKIMRNFVHNYEDGTTRQVFHVFIDQEEVSSDEVDALLEGHSFDAEDGPKVEVKLDLGAFTLIMMPRGSSKTTIAGLAVPLYKLLYQEDEFTLYVSKADRHSQGQLQSVRKELVNNEIIRDIFGDLKPRRSEEEQWSKEKFETVTGVAMQARGKGSAIRGVNHNNRRPSTIIVDDPQSGDDVKSDLIREDDKKWAFAELTPARARVIGTRGKIICLATWLHKQCLAAVWSRDPRWTSVLMGIKDSDGEYIWPDYMDAEEERIEKASYSRAGLLGDFYREYYNQEVIDDELPFKKSFIIYEPEVPRDKMVCATFADLASSEKRTADYSAIVTVGLDTSGLVWLLEAWIERVGIQEEVKVEEYFRQSIQWQSELHGFESNAYQAVFGVLLRAEMFRRGHYFEVEPVTHKTRKIDRIRGALRPRYAGGFVRHRIQFDEYETQLFDFRLDDSHEHDDGPDAAAAALVLLDPAAAYFAQKDPSEDQFEPLDEELYDGEEDTDYCWAS